MTAPSPSRCRRAGLGLPAPSCASLNPPAYPRPCGRPRRAGGRGRNHKPASVPSTFQNSNRTIRNMEGTVSASLHPISSLFIKVKLETQSCHQSRRICREHRKTHSSRPLLLAGTRRTPPTLTRGLWTSNSHSLRCPQPLPQGRRGPAPLTK